MSTRRIAATLLAAHILSMLGFSTYAALLPELRDLWRLSNAEAGAIGGALFFGYIGTVSFWTALTDRFDPRQIYFAGCALAAAGSAGFGVLTDGYVAALVCHALLGAGVAATYMPGLRILSDRTAGPTQSRYVAFYTSFFGIGIALSLVLAGQAAPVLGWRTAFLLAALGPLAAAALVAWGAPAARTSSPHGGYPVWRTLFPVAAWRRAMAQPAARGYTLGYFVHCLELFGSRAWMVAFLAYSAGLQATDAAFPWHAAGIAAAVNLASVPASILGNEVALRIGRRRWILIAMAGSGACGIVLGGAAAWHWSLVIALTLVYSMLVMAESATLTAGMIAAAPDEVRGAAMGLYSLAGFGGGMIGPVLFGAALDAVGRTAGAVGGAEQTGAWMAAYAAIGAGCLVAPFAVWLLTGKRRA